MNSFRTNSYATSVFNYVRELNLEEKKLVIPARYNTKYREQERGQAEHFAIPESMISNGYGRVI